MTPIEMAEAMEGRARVRRKITNRENTGDRLSDQLEQAATMLRQQQAEIEALKQIIDANNLNQNIGQFVKPTNEPVAWMDKESNITMIGGIYPKKLKQYLNGLEARIFALETNPVKELTDEEIRHIILKKASEK